MVYVKDKNTYVAVMIACTLLLYVNRDEKVFDDDQTRVDE